MIDPVSRHVLLRRTWFRWGTFVKSYPGIPVWSGFTYNVRMMERHWSFIDTENGVLPCWPAPRESRHWCGWDDHLLRFWHDGGDKVFHPREVAWTLLLRVRERCKKGLLFILKSIWKAQAHRVSSLSCLISGAIFLQVMKSLIDLGALRPTGDLSAVCPYQISNFVLFRYLSRESFFLDALCWKKFYFCNSGEEICPILLG